MQEKMKCAELKSRMEKINGDNRRISEISRKTQTKNLVNFIIKQKLSYAGHVARAQSSRWNKRITFWTPPYGKEKVGRPSIRWVVEIVGMAGRDWASWARHREEWADLLAAYTQAGALSEEES